MSTPHEVEPGLFIRGFTPPLRLADYKLVAFDMDSTLIGISASTRSLPWAGTRWRPSPNRHAR
jgi:phosphoserine phosphatase